MKKNLIESMVRMYGKDNKWVILFQDKIKEYDDTTVEGRWHIRRWFAYCDLHAYAPLWK